VTAGGIAVVAALAKLSGGSSHTDPVPSDITLPSTAATLPGQTGATAGATEFAIDGLSPLITPTDEFFRIDIAAGIPSIDVSTWRLRVGGRVAREVEFSYDDLLAMPQVTAPVTLACVSNPVGGDLIGTAVWQGVELRTLLERAGISSDAEQVVSRSSDGFRAGFPIECVTDGRAAIVAIGMNGAPLDRQHGFPARLIVEGLYGYVSATKWLQSIELRGWDEVDGYWIPLGWSKEGPVLASSRIDVPREGERVAAGAVVVAGVAWAPDSGVGSVQVNVDDGPWIDCELGDQLSGGTWRQWRTTLDLAAGSYDIGVRCIDALGEVQTAVVTPNPIAGATGHHHRWVNVR